MTRQNGKGIYREQTMISMLLILSDLVRYLEGSRVYRSTVRHKKS